MLSRFVIIWICILELCVAYVVANSHCLPYSDLRHFHGECNNVIPWGKSIDTSKMLWKQAYKIDETWMKIQSTVNRFLVAAKIGAKHPAKMRTIIDLLLIKKGYNMPYKLPLDHEIQAIAKDALKPTFLRCLEEFKKVACETIFHPCNENINCIRKCYMLVMDRNCNVHRRLIKEIDQFLTNKLFNCNKICKQLM